MDARAALGREERHDVVAGADDAGADPFDDAGALVAEHARRVPGRVGAGGGVEVGVADAARDEPDEPPRPPSARRASTSCTTSGLPNCSSTAARILTGDPTSAPTRRTGLCPIRFPGDYFPA